MGAAVENSVFKACCNEFPLGKVLPTLRQFTTDEISAQRHWPWAAFAIDQYNYEIKERAKYTDELSPKQIHELLEQIEGAAHNLTAALTTLQALAFRLLDSSAPWRRAHLSWLNYFISQALADNVSNEVTGDLVTIDFKKLKFIKRLAQVEAVAKVAIDRVDKDLLERKRGQSNPALPNFAWRCGEIWKSMTGRKPSANKAERRGADSNNPDFVIFMRTLAKIGNAMVPSRREIETALKMHTPRLPLKFREDLGCERLAAFYHGAATYRGCPVESGGVEMFPHEYKPRRMLSTPEAAHYCGSSASTLSKLRLYGGGPAFLKCDFTHSLHA